MNAFPFPIAPCVSVLVITAAVLDLRARRIPNWLVVAALVAALPVQWLAHGATDGLTGVLGGFLVGGVIFLPGYLVRAVGAGDVKLMAAVGALMGTSGTIVAALLACAVGGVWALLAMLLKRRLKDGLTNSYSMLLATTGGWRQAVQQGEVMRALSVGKLPFGVAIAIGALGAIAMTMQ
jgi:prepilin peptidase CpaA